MTKRLVAIHSGDPGKNPGDELGRTGENLSKYGNHLKEIR